MKRIKTMAKNEDYAHLFDKCQILHEQAYKTEKCLQKQKS